MMSLRYLLRRARQNTAELEARRQEISEYEQILAETKVSQINVYLLF